MSTSQALSKSTGRRDPRELSLEAAVQEIGSCVRNGMVLFVGAGVSVAPPAGCPTWLQLVEAVVESAAEAHARIVPLSNRVHQRWQDL